MAKTSIFDMKTEMVIFLRNADIISIGDRGVTTSTDTGSFVNISSHTLAVNPTLVKNVRSVTRGTLLVFGTDYTVNYETGVITFTVAQTGAYTIVYDQGSTEVIHPDFPQPYLKLSNFPRIACDIISGATSEFGIGATPNQSEYIMSITCYSKSQTEVETMVVAIRSALIDAKKDFFYMPFVTITSMGPLLITPFGQNKILQRNQDLMVRFVFES